jgi:phospholipid N-methyltransferase
MAPKRRTDVLSTLLAGFILVSAVSRAQDNGPAASYVPRVGQAGKDVVWVPTAQTLVEKMLDVAHVSANDYVIDLGSGDGRTVIAAAKRGARALGIEYNPEMVELSKRYAAQEGVSERAHFVKADIFESDLSAATVITMFLLTEINLKLRPKILALDPGTRIVSNTFSMGAWVADQIVTADENCQDYCVAYFWIVPAQVEGRWRLADGEIELKQSFQTITGKLTTAHRTSELADGQLAGRRISFRAGDTQYIGHISGDRMDGIFSSPRGKGEWTAARN